MLLLSPVLIWHWQPREGGQRRPRQLSPAHREFLKDARGCREGGRRGRGGWAGPPNPPPKKEGAGPVGGGGGRPSAWPLGAAPGGRGEGRPQAPSGSVDAWAGSPGAMLWPPPAQAIRGAESPSPAHSGIEAALFPRRAGLRPVPILGDRVMEGEEKGSCYPGTPWTWNSWSDPTLMPKEAVVSWPASRLQV